jgi:hypothetical protein
MVGREGAGDVGAGGGASSPTSTSRITHRPLSPQ